MHCCQHPPKILLDVGKPIPCTVHISRAHLDICVLFVDVTIMLNACIRNLELVFPWPVCQFYLSFVTFKKDLFRSINATIRKIKPLVGDEGSVASYDLI